MDTKKELKILFWMIVVYAAVFFMPLGNERFMTAVDATLDLAKWYAQEHVMLCLLPTFFIAGVIAVFVSQGSVLKYFGANAKKWLSRPFAIATALPVLIVAWILAFSVQHIGSFYGKMQTVQKWLNRIVGSIFAIIGLYYCVIMYL